jgi:tetratricopeptide (TPR) repeat protein
MHVKLRPAFASTAILLMALAAYWSIRLARADYLASQPDLPHLTRASQLVPDAAPYWLQSAALREVEQPDDPSIASDLNRALLLNPRSADAWMARAVRGEIAGNPDAAERDYLAATQIDHRYKPAWALANFYLRQQRTEDFWRWARRCLEVVEPRRLEPASYNPAPVFDLAWQVTQTPAEIRRRLIPPRHFILVDYLEYLGERNRADAGAAVAVDLTALGDPDDNYHLLNFCERLINMGKGAPAMQIWNAMIDHATIHAEPLDPAHGQLLTNADLKRPFERVGFDWRMPPAEGVLQNHFLDTGEVRFEFSGDQPEGVLTFYQSIPVVPDTTYRLTFRYRTPGMEHANGLNWQLWDNVAQRAIPVTCQLTANPEWSAGEARFTTPKGVSVLRLGLVYQRATGSTRIQGTAVFTDFKLTSL